MDGGYLYWYGLCYSFSNDLVLELNPRNNIVGHLVSTTDRLVQLFSTVRAPSALTNCCSS